MLKTLYHLKGTVISEPLINNWYACGGLISPLTYSMYLTERIIPVLESYLGCPVLHAKTANQLQLYGGIFVNLNSDKIDNVNDLLNSIFINCKKNISLADDIKILFKLTKEFSVKGESFEPLYQRIPEDLKGYVEIMYDTLNQPKIKFYEALFYRSHYYNKKFQSILLHNGNPDNRPFVLSTPRFKNEADFLIDLPFNDEAYDALYSSRQNGLTKYQLETLFDLISTNQAVNFDNFKKIFQERNIKQNTILKSKKVNIKYFGHACILIQTSKTTILVDPFISNENQNSDVARLSFADLPEKIDYVLLTHSHQDHTVLETLLQIRYKIETIIVPQNISGSILDPSLKLFLIACGFKKIIAADEFDVVNLTDGYIQCLPFMGEHGDLEIHSKINYIINVDKLSLAFMSDSNNISCEFYSLISNFIKRKIDIIFLGMECEGAPVNWLYEPLLINKLSKQQNQTRRLNGSDSVKALKLINELHCKNVFIYAMGHEPWIKFISSISFNKNSPQIQEANKLIEIGKKQNISITLLYGSQDITSQINK